MFKNKVVVSKTKRGCAYTIQIHLYGRVYSMGTGGYGLTYEQAVEEAKAISDRAQIDIFYPDKE